MEIDGQAPEENSQPSDLVALIEQSLVAVRHDLMRRRPPYRGEHGPGSGTPAGPFGGAPWGAGPWGEPPHGHGWHGGHADHRGRPDGSLGRAARFRMLDALEAAEKGGTELSISALAEAVGVDQPRASRLVQEGVDRGLVRRIQDPSDARRSLIQLTAAGRTQISEVRNHRRTAVEQAIAAFTPEEALTFATLFDRFVRAWPRD
ncbi:MAG TPA: MarR family winged helix-turn-helix transcriptional regulator [Leifsonia sp.]|nr:MarR family winged helix-turn-helix transcriptional regulator [Leifsonia sp.]